MPNNSAFDWPLNQNELGFLIGWWFAVLTVLLFIVKYWLIHNPIAFYQNAMWCLLRSMKIRPDNSDMAWLKSHEIKYAVMLWLKKGSIL